VTDETTKARALAAAEALAHARATTFTISLCGAEVLSIEEIWPDGDAPKNPTREDVAAVLAKYSARDLILDWGIGVDVEVDGLTVEPRGITPAHEIAARAYGGKSK
jgi:hypothetical protein